VGAVKIDGDAKKKRLKLNSQSVFFFFSSWIEQVYTN